MGWRAQKAEPVVRAKSLEQCKPASAVEACTFHQPEAQVICRIFHAPSRGQAAPTTIAIDNVGEFVSRSEGKLVIISREGKHSSGYRHIAAVTVCIDTAIREQDQPDAAVTDRAHRQGQRDALAAKRNAQIVAGQGGGNLVKQGIGGQRACLAPLHDQFGRAITNGNHLVARAQAGKVGGTTWRDTGYDGQVVHTERRRQQWPVALLVCTPVIEHDTGVGHRTRAGHARGLAQAPFDMAQSAKIVTQTGRPGWGGTLGHRRCHQNRNQHSRDHAVAEAAPRSISRKSSFGRGRIALHHNRPLARSM